MICVSLHRSGSVLADYTINAANNNLDFTSANRMIFGILWTKGIYLAPHAFAVTGKDEKINISYCTWYINSVSYCFFSVMKWAVCLLLSEQKNLSTSDKLYPQQRVELICTRPQSGEGLMKWKVNEKDVDKTKYFITNDGTLIIKNAADTDSGESFIFILFDIYNKI